MRKIFDHFAAMPGNADLSHEQHWTKVITLLQIDAGGRVQNTRGVQRLGYNTRMLDRKGDETQTTRQCETLQLRYAKPEKAGGQLWSD